MRPPSPTDEVRHHLVPSRAVGTSVVVARPGDGAPVVLPATAARVWTLLDEWTTPGELEVRLAREHPDMAAADRSETLTHLLDSLHDEGLLERR
jgi:hypothetical protein